MKRKLDLRTGRSVWMAYRSPAVANSSIAKDIRTQVLIVGAGISGAMLAEMLTDHGLDVVLIDRRGPMKGSTAASTALIQNEIDVPLQELIKKIGKGNAQAAWRRSRLAVSNLKARILELQIKCALAERPSLFLAGNSLDAEALQSEVGLRREAGLYADYLAKAQLESQFGISRSAAILNPENIAVDPRKLTSGLLNKAIKRGAKVFSPVEARLFQSLSDVVNVGTKQGPTISAQYVVLSTGYELTDLAPTKAQSVVSTWAIATKRQSRNLWPREAFIWEASDPYLYVRATPDGRVICGGEDEAFSDEQARDELIGLKAQRISQKLAKLLPQLEVTPEFAWAGSFGITPTGLPIICKIQKHPRIHSVMGYGGNGITFARIAAEIVTSSILDRRDGDSYLFAPK